MSSCEQARRTQPPAAEAQAHVQRMRMHRHSFHTENNRAFKIESRNLLARATLEARAEVERDDRRAREKIKRRMFREPVCGMTRMRRLLLLRAAYCSSSASFGMLFIGSSAFRLFR